MRERGGDQSGTFGDQENWFGSEGPYRAEDPYRGTLPPAQGRDERPPDRTSRTRLIAASVAVIAVGAAGWGAYAAGVFKHETTAAQTPASVTGPGTQTSSVTSPTTTASPAAMQIGWKAGLAAISNGTKTVTFGGVPVTFPTAVSDAAFSPDGSQIAFIDGDGDVAVSRLDGSDMVKVTRKIKTGDTYSRPCWGAGISIYFNAKNHGGQTIVEGGPPTPPDGPPEGQVPPWTADGTSDHSSALDGAVQVHQKQGKSGPEVWRQTFGQTNTQPAKVADGSEPAVSPDGKRIAYVGAAGAIEVMASSGKSTKIGTASGAAHLTWTPDGKSVAFSSAKGIEQVLASGGAPILLSSSPGVVSFLPTRIDRVVSLSGGDLVAESIAASEARWPSQQTTPLPTFNNADENRTFAVTLGAKEHPELALEAGYSLGNGQDHHGPLLFTSGSSLDSATAGEIKRVLGSPHPGATSFNGGTSGYDVDSVTLLGGTDIISPAVETAIKALGYQTNRVDASDTFAMAAKIGPTSVGSIAPSVVIAAADDPSGIAAGVTTGDAVIITDGSTMPPSMQKILNMPPSGPGGEGPGPVTLLPIDAAATAAAATTWPGKPTTFKVKDLSAKGAGAASAALLQTHTWFPPSVIVVPKGSVTDAVLAAAMARTMPLDTAVLVVDPATGLDADTATILKQNSAAVSTVYVVDGGGTLSQSVRDQLGAAISGPLGWDAATNPKTAAKA